MRRHATSSENGTLVFLEGIERHASIRTAVVVNVVLEMGFFSGALSRSHVCVLYKVDVEIPSGYLFVVYVQMDEAGAWRFALAKELKQAGLPVDLNRLA